MRISFHDLLHTDNFNSTLAQQAFSPESQNQSDWNCCGKYAAGLYSALLEYV